MKYDNDPSKMTRRQPIIDLASRAGATDEQGGRAQTVFCFTAGELQGFAQLIVLECEKVAKDPQWYSKSPSNSWRNPINHVCSVMKEHFGVEE